MDIFVRILSDAGLQGAVFSTVFIILLGYYARKKAIVPENSAKVLSAILLNLTLPFLAFNAFMTKIDDKTFKAGLSTFLFGFIAYVLLIGVSYLLYPHEKGNRKDTLRVLTIFGSTTFFGIPIINAILPSGTLYANLFNVAYRVFLYSYGLIVMSGSKFDRKNIKSILLNPIVIATFIGFIIWMVQPYLPKVEVMVTKQIIENGKIVSKKVAELAPVLRLDQTLPWMFRGFKFLGDLSSPLAWLAIGMTLASINLKEAIKDKTVWYYSLVKLLIVPAVFLVVMYVVNLVGTGIGFSLTYDAVLPITIMLATPPATVAVAYAINFEKESVLASNASLLSTFISVFAIILWVIILATLHAAHIF